MSMNGQEEVSVARVEHVTGVSAGGRLRPREDRAGRPHAARGDRRGPGPSRHRDTPARVARAYDEMFAGLLIDPADVISVTFDEAHDEIVMMRDIPFHSMCEHHLVPFMGEAHVAYLPSKDGRITGLSKLARLVDVCAKRPGLQERMTTQIADALERALEPRGVLVVLEARHLCMEMRGIRKPGASTVTSTVRGIFRDDEKTRAEAMALLRR
jgi:GTP cyclohydrolase IA